MDYSEKELGSATTVEELHILTAKLIGLDKGDLRLSNDSSGTMSVSLVEVHDRIDDDNVNYIVVT